MDNDRDALLAEATALYRSLTTDQRCEALKQFRLIRARVPKPKTGPLPMPAASSAGNQSYPPLPDNRIPPRRSPSGGLFFLALIICLIRDK